MKLARFLIIALVFSNTAIAAEDAARQKAKELIEVTQTAKMMDQVYPQVEAMIAQPLVGLKADPNYQEIATRYEKRMIDTLMQDLKWEKMEGEVIDLYTRVFTEQELGDLIIFYRSELGQKLLQRMPTLMQETMSLTQNRIKVSIPKVQALGAELQVELKAAKEKAEAAGKAKK